MKLSVSSLTRFIELPHGDPKSLRNTFDDLGLEVKESTETAGDQIFNIETLANRGDHLSILGIARELSARTLAELKTPKVATFDSYTTLKIGHSDTEMCLGLAFIELELRNLQLDKESADTLRKIGHQTGHHPLVDYLIYVQHELGQPMHAYDKDRLAGNLTVRLSNGGEHYKALNGKDYVVPPRALIVQDDNEIVALMGVMGGENSKVTASTKRAIVEVAVLDPVSVRKAAKAVKISSEASYNFERGVDPAGMRMAIGRLLNLLGDSVQVVGIQIVKEATPKEIQHRLSIDKLSQQMNVTLDATDIVTRLGKLGFKPSIKDKILTVTTPSWRSWDISSTDCIIEEYTRVFGINNVIPSLPTLQLEAPRLSPVEIIRTKIDPILLGHGFTEVITTACYSSAEKELLTRCDPTQKDTHVNIANSIDSKYGFMRTTPMLHLLRAAIENRKRGVTGIKIGEFCKSFTLSEPGTQSSIIEKELLSLVVGATYFDNIFKQRKDRNSIYYLTGLFEQIFGMFGVTVTSRRSANKLLHPARSVDFILSGSTTASACVGEIHPMILDAEGTKERYYFGVITLESLPLQQQTTPNLYPTEFPAIERDITVLAPVELLSKSLADRIYTLKLQNLVAANVVDDFQKPGESIRRITLACRFTANDRTLSTIEVDQQFAEVTRLLINELKLQQG